jgi:hypothetical protein
LPQEERQPRRGLRFWGRLEEHTRAGSAGDHAPLTLAEEPAWAAAFTAPLPLLPPAGQAGAAAGATRMERRVALLSAAWHADGPLSADVAASSGSAASSQGLQPPCRAPAAAELLAAIGRCMGPEVAAVVQELRQRPPPPAALLSRQQQQQCQGAGSEGLGFWGTVLLAVACAEDGRGVAALVRWVPLLLPASSSSCDSRSLLQSLLTSC